MFGIKALVKQFIQDEIIVNNIITGLQGPMRIVSRAGYSFLPVLQKYFTILVLEHYFFRYLLNNPSSKPVALNPKVSHGPLPNPNIDCFSLNF